MGVPRCRLCEEVQSETAEESLENWTQMVRFYICLQNYELRVEAEELEVFLHLGGLVDVFHRVVGALGHLALHVDQVASLFHRG